MDASGMELQSFIGSEIAEPDYYKPDNLDCLELVASIDFGTGPGGGDYRTYLLERSPDGADNTLWLEIFDVDLGVRRCRLACGWPADLTSQKSAELLLLATWRDECRFVADRPEISVLE